MPKAACFAYSHDASAPESPDDPTCCGKPRSVAFPHTVPMTAGRGTQAPLPAESRAPVKRRHYSDFSTLPNPSIGRPEERARTFANNSLITKPAGMARRTCLLGRLSMADHVSFEIDRDFVRAPPHGAIRFSWPIRRRRSTRRSTISSISSELQIRSEHWKLMAQPHQAVRAVTSRHEPLTLLRSVSVSAETPLLLSGHCVW